MSRWEKDRKLSVLIELEKLRNIDFSLLWNYLNSELLDANGSKDENFVRADDFHQYLEPLLDSRVDLKKELLGDEFKNKLIL